MSSREGGAVFLPSPYADARSMVMGWLHSKACTICLLKLTQRVRQQTGRRFKTATRSGRKSCAPNWLPANRLRMEASATCVMQRATATTTDTTPKRSSALTGKSRARTKGCTKQCPGRHPPTVSASQASTACLTSAAMQQGAARLHSFTQRLVLQSVLRSALMCVQTELTARAVPACAVAAQKGVRVALHRVPAQAALPHKF